MATSVRRPTMSPRRAADGAGAKLGRASVKKLTHILVGVDGSDESRAAHAWACGLAELAGAEVVSIHALGLLEDLDGEKVPAQAHRAEIERRFTTEWSPSVRDVIVRREIRDGNPVDVLLRASVETDADIIVVGNRGVGGFPSELLGSTSSQIAQRADRPVTIMKATT